MGASAPPLFAAAGYTAARIVSDDGKNWRNLIVGREGHVFRAMAFGLGRFVASGTIGGPGLHSTTTDGAVWRTIGTPEAKDGGTGIKGVAFGNGQFIAFGGEPGAGGIEAHNNVMTSVDGLKWSEYRYPSGKRLIRRVAFGSGLFVGVGDAGRRAASKNGIDWNDAPDPVAKNTLVDVAFGKGLFVGVGLHSLRMSTTDGIHWSNRQVGEEGEHLNSIVFTGDRFVAAGPSVTCISPDGINWKRFPIKTGPLTMTYAEGSFVGSQWKGRLLHSIDAIEWTETFRIDHHIEALATSRPPAS